MKPRILWWVVGVGIMGCDTWDQREGWVMSRVTGKPLEGARIDFVLVEDGVRVPGGMTQTDKNGHFETHFHPPRTHYFVLGQVSAPGHSEVEIGISGPDTFWVSGR